MAEISIKNHFYPAILAAFLGAALSVPNDASATCSPESIELISTARLSEPQQPFLDQLEGNLQAPEIDPSASPCKQAQALVMTFEVNPIGFVTDNGFFQLMNLQNDLGYPEIARETYKSWPWAEEALAHFSPWAHVPEEEADFYYYLVLDLFSQSLPKRVGKCIYNPVTTFCDDGFGLEFVGSEFQTRFPDSGLTRQVLEIERKYKAHLYLHNMYILDHNIKRAKKNPLRLYAGLERALKIKGFANETDKAKLNRIIKKLANKLKTVLKSDPKARNRMPDSFEHFDLDAVILSH